MAGILACVEMVAVSELHEIAWLAYLGQIMNIGSSRARKLEKLLENGCNLRITRNCTGRIFRPNNKYWKCSRAKIIKRALLGRPIY